MKEALPARDLKEGITQPEAVQPRIIDAEALLHQTFETDPRQGCALLFRLYYAPLCSHVIRFVYSKQVAEILSLRSFTNFGITEFFKKLTRLIVPIFLNAPGTAPMTTLNLSYQEIRRVCSPGLIIMLLTRVRFYYAQTVLFIISRRTKSFCFTLWSLWLVCLGFSQSLAAGTVLCTLYK